MNYTEDELFDYYIYKIINKINGKMYVGQHKIYPGEAFRRYMGKGIAIREAIKKYGKENFDKEVIEYIQDNEKHEYVSEREKFWIKELNTLSPNGYNISPGGEGGCTKESAKKVIETKRKNGTLKHSNETKVKISKAHFGRKFSEEHKQHLSDNHHSKTAHIIIFENGEKEITTKSIANIAKEYGTHVNTLIRCSAKKKFINGIYLDNINGNNYACCRSSSPIDSILCKDPIMGDICTYKNLRQRIYRHKDIYQDINIKDCVLKEG